MVYEGTVVGLKKRSAVVMTGDCQFREIPRTPAMLSGQKVYFTGDDLVKPAANPPLRFTAVAASLLVCFVLAFSLLQGITDKTAFAYINLEVNPALEISLDKELKVRKVRGLNRDGRDIAKGLKMRGQDAGEAVQAVLGACVESGYINGDHNRVLLATTFAVENEKLQEELDHRIWEGARKGVAAGQSEASIYIFNADPALREQAAKKGVSAGRYLLWRDAQNSGLQCDLDGPLSGPAFSRSAGRLSRPFTEKSGTEDTIAPASPVPQGDRADHAPASPPGSGAAPEKVENKQRNHASTTGVGKNTENDAEKRGGKPGDTGDTPRADTAKPETTRKPASPAEGVNDPGPNSDPMPPGGGKDNKPAPPEDAAKPKKDRSSSDPADRAREDGSGNADSRSQGSDGPGGSGGSGGHGSGGKGGGSGGKGGGKK